MKKNQLTIPVEFELFGQTVEIIWDKELNNRDNANGLANYRYSRIELQPNTDTIKITDEMIEQTYLHEVTHFILDAIGEDELRSNEKFVDTFSKALHQVLKTSKFD